MKTLERYIYWRMVRVFVITLGSIGAIIWATQALRQFDLVSAKGQTFWQFFKMTMMIMPFLLMNFMPFVLMMTMIMVLIALINDSELNAIYAAGISNLQLLKPFLKFAAVITIILYGLSLYAAPTSLKLLRNEILKVKFDLVANIMKPGQFHSIQDGLTIHMKNRSGRGQLQSLLLDDRRNPSRQVSYIAKNGVFSTYDDKLLLFMTDGVIQRYTPESGAMSFVKFKEYAFDFSTLNPPHGHHIYTPNERNIFDLISIPEDDPYYISRADRFERTFNDILSLPIFALTFCVIVFVFLGNPDSLREKRQKLVIIATLSCFLLKIVTFGLNSISPISTVAKSLVFILPIGIFIWLLIYISRDKPPQYISKLTLSTARLLGRFLVPLKPYQKAFN